MSWGWQEWAVALLIVLCVVRMIYVIRLFFRREKRGDNPCANCVSGCELKQQLEKKQDECQSRKNSSKKNSCV